ncbi:MAG: DDE-type integrase/transposase/recombinase, partial [Bacteroidota bacterium]
MLEYDFTIRHTPGKQNGPPDFLSRNVISAVNLTFDGLVQAQEQDKGLQDLAKAHPQQFTNRNGLLLMHHKGRKRIYLPPKFRPALIQACHNSLLGGHMGMFKTAARIAHRYYWPNMNKDIKNHILSCHTCQTLRKSSQPPATPLQPLPNVDCINHRVHLDLFGPLATSNGGNKFILVITDAFSKYVEVVALQDKAAATVADALFNVWITRYGPPQAITTDGGKEFCNQMMNRLCEKLQILHKHTSPYHPQANAQVEVFNRTMKKYIQSFISTPFLDWEDFLPPIRLCYNTSVSKATMDTPFSLVFGMEPHIPFLDLERYVDYDETSANAGHLQRLWTARKLAAQNNLEYKQKYKEYFDRSSQPSQIQKGDWVYLKAVPQKHKNPKLHPYYEGPFLVTWCNDKNAKIIIRSKTRLVSSNVAILHKKTILIPKPIST